MNESFQRYSAVDGDASGNALTRGYRFPVAWYVAATLAAVETPTGFLDAWRAVVDGPDARNGAELVERLDAWLGEAVAPDDTLSTFIRDNELAWLRGTVPAEYF